jgi:hypothetical protein
VSTLTSKPSVIQRVYAAADRGEIAAPLAADIVAALNAPETSEVERLRTALAMIYDKWEEGTPSYQDPEDYTGYLGMAFKLTQEEEARILALLPPQRESPSEKAPLPMSEPLTSNGNNEPMAVGHAGWCLYRLDCERKADSPRECNCGTRPLAESLRQALKWDWPNIPRDALGNIQHALKLALEVHSNETPDIREQIRTGCDVALKFTMPTAVAEILGNIRALVSDRPAQKASACPKCDAVRKLGLTSCFEHAPTQKASSS